MKGRLYLGDKLMGDSFKILNSKEQKIIVFYSDEERIMVKWDNINGINLNIQPTKEYSIATIELKEKIMENTMSFYYPSPFYVRYYGDHDILISNLSLSKNGFLEENQHLIKDVSAELP